MTWYDIWYDIYMIYIYDIWYDTWFFLLLHAPLHCVILHAGCTFISSLCHLILCQISVLCCLNFGLVVVDCYSFSKSMEFMNCLNWFKYLFTRSLFLTGQSSSFDAYAITLWYDIWYDIKTKQLKWYGHVQRMEEGRLPKNVMKWSPPGRRKRGRPKLTWAEEIRGLMEEKGLMEEHWNDRDNWRKNKI